MKKIERKGITGEKLRLDIAERTRDRKKQIENDILWKQANNNIESMFTDCSQFEFKIIKALSCCISYPYFKLVDLKVNKIIDVYLPELAGWLDLKPKQLEKDKDKIINDLLKKQARFNLIDDQCKIVQIVSNIFVGINYYESNYKGGDAWFEFEVNYEVLNALINLNKENLFFYDPDKEYEEDI